jgi:hypothetical protein
MDKLIGFAPDAEPTTPGVLTDCANFIPYEQGMKAAPSGTTPTNVPALAAACNGAAVVTKLDDSRRTFAGSATALYELSGGSWSAVTRGTGAYTGGSDTRWSFAQFGDATLAANLSDTIQRSNGSGAFADVATAPKAKIIFSVGAFVMALNTVDGIYGTSPDRWWCCASYDDTSWTPSGSTLATTGRLVASPGRITAGLRLGEYAVAYKEKSIYLGQFVGAPAVWDWRQVQGGDAGCIGQDAVCDIGGTHFIVGTDNFWLFNGGVPQPIGTGVLRQWFFSNSNTSFAYKTQCVYDKQNQLVYTFYPSLNSTTIDSVLVYHVLTKQWGRMTMSAEAVVNYIASGVTIDGLSSVSATIDGLSGYAFDSPIWNAGARALAVINTSHQLQLLTGAAGSSSFTTGDAGDDDTFSCLVRVRIRFAPSYVPTTANITTFSKSTEGASLSQRATGSINDGKFDVLQSDRFHRARFDFTGDARVLAYGAAIVAEGTA